MRMVPICRWKPALWHEVLQRLHAMYRTRQRLRDAMLESGVIDVVAEVGWFIRHYDVFLGCQDKLRTLL